jgi:hypothetical protein
MTPPVKRHLGTGGARQALWRTDRWSGCRPAEVVVAHEIAHDRGRRGHGPGHRSRRSGPGVMKLSYAREASAMSAPEHGARRPSSHPTVTVAPAQPENGSRP